MAGTRTPRPAAASAAGGAPRKVHFDLNSAQKPDTVEPFVALVGERDMEFGDIRDIEWKESWEIGNDPHLLLSSMLSEDDYDHLCEQKIPGWKLNLLLEQAREHYNPNAKPGRR